MSDLEKSPRLKMPWRRAWVGSFLAALAGWVLLNVFLLAFSLLTAPKPLQGFNEIWFIAIGSGLFVLVVWIAFLLPIYHEVPSQSPIWRWPISTALGAFSGYLLMSFFIIISAPHDAIINNKTTAFLFNGFNIYAAICGASIGLFAGLTARYFHANRTR